MNSLVKKLAIFSRECEHITLVFDKGNNSRDNLEMSDDFFYLGSLAPSQHRKLLEIDVKEYEIKHKSTSGEMVIAHHLKKKVFGREMDVVITYNEKTAYNQKKRMERRRVKGKKYMEDAMLKLNTARWTDRDTVMLRINTNLTKKHANDLIWWKLTEKSKQLQLEYHEKKEVIEINEKSFGKNILFTDNKSLKPFEIIDAYHAKWVVEYAIKRLKNHHTISLSPQHCWTDRSIRVHAFTCVMALTFLSLLEKKVDDKDIRGSVLLTYLKGIRQGLVLMPYKRKIIPIIEKRDAVQRKLYQILNMEAYEKIR